MSPTINAFALLDHLEKLAAVETAAIVASEEGAERRRGRLDMLAQVTLFVKRPNSTPERTTSYEDGIAPVAAY